MSVTCRGVAVTGDLRIASRSEAEAFIELSEPLPVGTTVVVTVGDEPAFEARVLKVREDIAGRDDAAGMQVAIGAPPLAIARAAVKAEAEAEAAQAPAQAPGEAAPESETAQAPGEAAPEAAPASGE
ncbi:MAG TPA: hypothetical protein VFG83_05845, partial [Kofleriaceae bacterium]|nr:hypothetical protein [Kofleriaceae bacterium]